MEVYRGAVVQLYADQPVVEEEVHHYHGQQGGSIRVEGNRGKGFGSISSSARSRGNNSLVLDDGSAFVEPTSGVIVTVPNNMNKRNSQERHEFEQEMARRPSTRRLERAAKHPQEGILRDRDHDQKGGDSLLHDVGPSSAVVASATTDNRHRRCTSSCLVLQEETRIPREEQVASSGNVKTRACDDVKTRTTTSDGPALFSYVGSNYPPGRATTAASASISCAAGGQEVEGGPSLSRREREENALAAEFSSLRLSCSSTALGSACTTTTSSLVSSVLEQRPGGPVLISNGGTSDRDQHSDHVVSHYLVSTTTSNKMNSPLLDPKMNKMERSLSRPHQPATSGLSSYLPRPPNPMASDLPRPPIQTQAFSRPQPTPTVVSDSVVSPPRSGDLSTTNCGVLNSTNIRNHNRAGEAEHAGLVHTQQVQEQVDPHLSVSNVAELVAERNNSRTSQSTFENIHDRSDSRALTEASFKEVEPSTMTRQPPPRSQVRNLMDEIATPEVVASSETKNGGQEQDEAGESREMAMAYSYALLVDGDDPGAPGAAGEGEDSDVDGRSAVLDGNDQQSREKPVVLQRAPVDERQRTGSDLLVMKKDQKVNSGPLPTRSTAGAAPAGGAAASSCASPVFMSTFTNSSSCEGTVNDNSAAGETPGSRTSRQGPQPQGISPTSGSSGSPPSGTSVVGSSSRNRSQILLQQGTTIPPLPVRHYSSPAVFDISSSRTARSGEKPDAVVLGSTDPLRAREMVEEDLRARRSRCSTGTSTSGLLVDHASTSYTKDNKDSPARGGAGTTTSSTVPRSMVEAKDEHISRPSAQSSPPPSDTGGTSKGPDLWQVWHFS
ncbi:unnamed protein product [Amoebophrya sp. A25]|nr:unnamed protein product [Amoebophrya sp. A25]|eukprot:GSA25T00021079001.1